MSPTIRQTDVAEEIVKIAKNESDLKTAKEVLVKCRYGKGLQKQPNRVFQSKGVKEALAIKGFSEQDADRTVGHILLKGKREENKLKAADIIYKRIGSYAPEKKQSLNLNIELPAEAEDLIGEYEAKLRKRLKLPENDAI